MTRRTTPIMLLLGALFLSACAGAIADDTPAPTTQPGIDVGEPTPGSGDGELPPAGMCVPEVPDCVDTVVIDDGAAVPPEEEIVYRPIGVEGDVAGEGQVIGGGEVLAIEGNRIQIGFWMGVEDCYAVERIDLAETETKVAVDITVAPRAVDQVCIELAEARSVWVELEAPVGGRIVEIGGVTING